MRRPAVIDSALAALLREASRNVMTSEEKERQLVSLAYGNAKLENDQVSKPVVADAVRQTRRRP
jgi:hypothetical protein